MSKYEYITKHNSPRRAHTKAKRGAAAIDTIVIHHWDDVDRKPTFAGTIAWLTRAGASTSAHYVVEAGRVACIVSPRDIAWHAGNWGWNQRSIGIELNPRASAGDYATAGELIRELRAAYGDMPLKAHKAIKATSCPGRYVLASLDDEARGKMTGPTPVYYTVKPGDTLGRIARSLKTTVAKLAKRNGIEDPNKIRVGQKIK